MGSLNRTYRIFAKFGISVISVLSLVLIGLIVYVYYNGLYADKQLVKDHRKSEWIGRKREEKGIQQEQVAINAHFLSQKGVHKPVADTEAHRLHVQAPVGKHSIVANVNKSTTSDLFYKFHQSNGVSFNISSDLADRMALKNLIKTLEPKGAEQFVVAMAAGKHQFEESILAIVSIHRHLPKYTIYYYDLGLASEQVKEVKTWCSVRYRKFNFSQYPSHVQNLKNFAYRPLIIQELLHEFDGVLWLDWFVRLKASDLTHVYRKVSLSSGLVQLHKTAYTNFAVTHAAMYSYLPTDVARQQSTNQGLSDALLVFRTQFAYERVLRWWFYCALDERCIAPTYARKCDFSRGKTAVYVDCHRMDQSSLGILLSNAHEFDVGRYVVHRSVIEFSKKKGKVQHVRKCAQH